MVIILQMQPIGPQVSDHLQSRWLPIGTAGSGNVEVLEEHGAVPVEMFAQTPHIADNGRMLDTDPQHLATPNTDRKPM